MEELEREFQYTLIVNGLLDHDAIQKAIEYIACWINLAEKEEYEAIPYTLTGEDYPNDDNAARAYVTKNITNYLQYFKAKLFNPVHVSAHNGVTTYTVEGGWWCGDENHPSEIWETLFFSEENPARHIFIDAFDFAVPPAKKDVTQY